MTLYANVRKYLFACCTPNDVGLYKCTLTHYNQNGGLLTRSAARPISGKEARGLKRLLFEVLVKKELKVSIEKCTISPRYNWDNVTNSVKHHTINKSIIIKILKTMKDPMKWLLTVSLINKRYSAPVKTLITQSRLLTALRERPYKNIGGKRIC